MSVEQIERELGKLRTNDDGTLALRSSVLNLMVVTDEESAEEITTSVSKLAGRYPTRAVLFIADTEDEPNVDVGLSAFCHARGGGGAQVCAEQITIHAEGPPAAHLESFAGPLLIPDLPVFLWYPGAFSPRSPEFAAMARLADRVILDSAGGPQEDHGACLRQISNLLEDPATPAIGDLQWVGLSPWRSLLADTFGAPERAGELEKIERIEILYAPGGENRALLLIGWLASTLGWTPESITRNGRDQRVEFSGPSGGITVELSPDSPDARLRRVRLYSEEYSFQVSRHRAASDVRTTVMRGEELLAERTVHIGSFDLGVLVGEEMAYRGHDEAYGAALRAAVEMLGPVNVDVYDNPEELAQAAAREFADKAAEAIGERGRFAVVLAGGSTPKTTYDILARDYKDRIDWKDVHVFFGDERGVPPDNDDSNYKMARESLPDHVPIGSVHRMRGELPPDDAAEAYERGLRDFFGPVDLPEFDLILLGTGPDGHTASLFPETSALEVHDRWVVANPVLKLETTRITLTLPAINAARNIFFLVAGEGKAAPVAEILQGTPDPRQYPASLIQPEYGPTWMLDRAAASSLA